MSEIKNLENKEAVEKLKEMAEDIRICMFCSELENLPFSTRPMSMQEVDDDGNLWFLSNAESNKNFEIQADQKVQLIFSKPSSAKFLSVFGSARIYNDRKEIERVWAPIANAWFEHGKDDPKATAICVNPSEIYYWDTISGKMLTLLKIATTAVTGKKMNTGVEGELDV